MRVLEDSLGIFISNYKEIQYLQISVTLINEEGNVLLIFDVYRGSMTNVVQRIKINLIATYKESIFVFFCQKR